MAYTFRDRQLPGYIEDSIRAYIDEGRPTGGFLCAVISNNLSLACALADEDNLWIMPVVWAFLYNEAPSQCWGKPYSFENWTKAKRAEREKAGVV